MTVLDLFIFSLCVLCIVRILTYRRNSKGFKRHVSLIAWLIIVGLAYLAISIATGNLTRTGLMLFIVPLISALTISLFVCRGNVSTLIKRIAEVTHATFR